MSFRNVVSVFLVTLCSSALTSCASAPKVEHPDLAIDAPEDWTGRDGGGKASQDFWWKEFEDEHLEFLVNEALSRSFDILDALARVSAAMAEARIAGADLTPRVGFSFDGARQKQTFVGIDIPGSDGLLTSRFNRFEGMFNLSWELDVWGRIRAGHESALAEVQASEADLRGARESVIAQICRNWFSAVEARQQLALAQATAASFRTSTNWIRERYELGLRPPLDLRLALSNLSAAEALAYRREIELDSLTRQLEILLGRYPAGDVAATLGESTELGELTADVPAGLPTDLLLRRPDIRFAERQLASSGALVRQARAALFPRLSLTAGGGTVSDELKDLVDPDFSVWNLGGNLTQPLLEGGRLLAQVDLADARNHQALAAYGKTVLRAYGEVESTLATEGFLEQRETALADAAEQSRGARSLAEEQYRNGLVDVLVLVESQRRELEAESELLAVRRQRFETRVDLHKALGGGYRGMNPKRWERGLENARWSRE
jgi:multidrug efflux system outer membrane protein